MELISLSTENAVWLGLGYVGGIITGVVIIVAVVVAPTIIKYMQFKKSLTELQKQMDVIKLKNERETVGDKT